jgi:hypothetical protein
MHRRTLQDAAAHVVDTHALVGTQPPLWRWEIQQLELH